MTLAAVPAPDEPVAVNQIVITMLEELLEEARRGEIRACAVAIVTADGCTSDRRAAAAGLKPCLMVGAIEILKARYVAALVEETNA
jgi:hypothetical protein